MQTVANSFFEVGMVMGKNEKWKQRRLKAWNKIRASAAAVKNGGATSAWRTGLVIGGIIFTLWTNSIRNKADDATKKINEANTKAESVAREFESYKQGAKSREEGLNTQVAVLQIQYLNVNSQVSFFEKKLRDYEIRFRGIEKRAKQLPPSQIKDDILRLAKPLSQATPLRADKPAPNM